MRRVNCIQTKPVISVPRAELEQEMARRETQVADSLAAAQKISTQFTEKDRQVHELQTLLETVSTERDELHHVIREFESKDEEQVRSVDSVPC